MKRSLAAYEASRSLAAAIGQDPLAPVGTFTVRSKSRTGRSYEMLHTPEGYAVHQGEGCEGEIFNGPLGCYHSKDYSVNEEEIEDMSNAVVPYESKVPERIDFTSEQLDTIAKVICVDSEGKVAPASFVQLFIAACRHTGLDPFLKQIYAMNMRGKWTMFVGVDGYRVVSERTGLDQGMDGPQWSDDGQTWYDYPPAEGAATYCRVAVWRKGVPRPYIAVLPLSARIQPTSDSWKKDPNGMLAKCCEVLARRRAFPADMAVLDNTVEFDASDGERPITRAEVPEGSWRAIEEAPQPPNAGDARLDDEHEDAQQAPVSASDGTSSGNGAGRPVGDSTPAAPSPALNPVQLLDEISARHGLKGKQAAIAVMSRFYDTTVITKLDADQRAEYAALLKVRLNDEGHDHELAYTAKGTPVCGICGDEVAEPVPAGAST